MINKLFLWIFSVLLVFSVVFAGEIVHVDIIKDDSFVILGEKDAVSLSYHGKDSLLIVRRIQNTGSAVDFAFFSDAEDEQALPFYTTLNVKDVMNVDLNKDFKNDYLVGLYDITGNKVTLLVRTIEDSGDTVDYGIADDYSNGGSSSILFYALLAITVVLLFILFKQKKSDDDLE